MRDIYKNIEVPVFEEPVKFRIKKMNALDGSALIKFLTAKCIPFLQEAINKVNAEEGKQKTKKTESQTDALQIVTMIPELLSTITDDDLKNLMVMCLKTVEASFPAGWQPVIDAHDNFGVDDLEYDTVACILLCYHVIAYNCSGFFGESGLSSLLGNKLGLPQKQ